MKLKINWSYITFVIILTALLFGYLEWFFINTTAKNHTELFIKIVFISGIPLMFMGLLGKIARDMKTRITETFISRPSFFFKENRIYWRYLQKIRRYRMGVHFHGIKNKIVLTPHAYLNPDDIIAFVENIEGKFLKQNA